MFLHKKSSKKKTRQPHPNQKAFAYGSDYPLMSTPARALAGFNPFAPMLDDDPPRPSEMIKPIVRVNTVSKPLPHNRRVHSDPGHNNGKQDPQHIERNRSYLTGSKNKTSSTEHDKPTALAHGDQYPWGRKQSVSTTKQYGSNASMDSFRKVSPFIPSKYFKKTVGHDLPEIC